MTASVRSADAAILAGYRPLPGVPDEMMDAAGCARPAWQRFIDHFSALDSGEMARRFGVNLVMYALTGNYKTDQVHIPALLERLGQ